MKVLEFIKTHPNWEELLAQEPYYITTIHDGAYFLLRYNQLASDFSNEIVRECRGCIFFEPTLTPVCVPFFKFGNYGESYVPEIDWASARVLEKIDGSLIKLWYHHGGWHISTNNTIDASNAETPRGNSFRQIFLQALKEQGNPWDFFASLSVNYTYMFELVSPETQVVIAYPEPKIYFLSARRMDTLEEVWEPYLRSNDFYKFVSLPKQHMLTTQAECITFAETLDHNHEGFVVCDKFGNRMKIKSPAYLTAARLRNNNVITVRRIVEMIRANTLDDFCAYAPDHMEYVQKVLDAYNAYIQDLNFAARKYLPTESFKVLAKALKNEPSHISGYVFAVARHGIDAFEWIDNMFLSTLVDVIKLYMEEENDGDGMVDNV